MWNWNDNTEDKGTPQPGHPSVEGSIQVKNNPESRRKNMGQTAIIGQSIQIKGELTGNEDMTIDGTVEGNIELKANHLTIGPNGNIKADLNAKTVTITGKVDGNITAEEKVEIRETGKVRGNIVAPRVAISDGAFFKGSVEMEKKSNLAKEKQHRDEKLDSRPELLTMRP
ncbi:MAG: polymer-forming cytoskeletal protein [Nitrospira sp.]|nr:polymer-forming cytoskeletal protein [Nitrospira sp.]